MQQNIKQISLLGINNSKNKNLKLVQNPFGTFFHTADLLYY